MINNELDLFWVLQEYRGGGKDSGLRLFFKGSDL